MSKMLTEPEKVTRCVDHYEALLHRLDRPPSSLSQCPASHLHVVLTKAGRSRISPKFLATLEAGFAERGVRTFPALTDPTLERRTRVHFFLAAHPLPPLQPPRVLFPEERQLQWFLTNNFALIDHLGRNGLRLRKEEARLPNGARIDLLCERRKPHELVGVELKHQEPGDRLVGQVGHYLEGLAELAADEGIASSSLLIVTGQPDPAVQRSVADIARDRGAKVEWLLYRVTLELEPVEQPSTCGSATR